MYTHFWHFFKFSYERRMYNYFIETMGLYPIHAEEIQGMYFIQQFNELQIGMQIVFNCMALLYIEQEISY